MLKSAFVAMALIAFFTSFMAVAAKAFVPQEGCKTTCLAHCERDIPKGPDYDVKMQKCINYWAPQNRAKWAAIKQAKAKAAAERATGR
jgi:hypothetical protein